MNRAAETLHYEDPLTYLPRKTVQEFARGRAIFDAQQPADHLYVIIAGRVKIGTTSDDGCQIVNRIVGPEGLFGESCLLGVGGCEAAVALDNTTVMAWSRNDVEHQIELEPRLGLALSQFLVRQCISLQERIECMAVLKTPERVMSALLQLAEETGSPAEDGAIRIASLAHHTIAEYVGTSREIVTFQMNKLRRLGLIRYSRKHIDVYTHAMTEALRERGAATPRRLAEAQSSRGVEAST